MANGLTGLLGGSVQNEIPGRTRLLSQFTPENQALFNDLISQILGQYQQGGFDFEPVAQQARTQFEQKTVPSIAERFTSMGGGQRSSGFQQALGQAGAGLEGQLASLGSQYGLQQQGLLQNLLGMGRQEPLFQQQSHGLLGGLLPSLISTLGQAGGTAARAYMGGF